ncbi:hypothetical protein DYB31_005957 [Aphanomyces astaci]|uniref:Uncharacterized protein n=1 Tax=Aphanomyces astaci TaxID=112090 RepID=A0A397EVQ1_APHAT|nr:hypothetical protein DYB31_005957 [Aphanomyces astaci]
MMVSGAVDGDAGESCTLVGGAVSYLPFSRGPNGVKVSTGVAGTVLIPIEPPVERPSLGVDPDVGEARTELGVTMGMLFDDEAGGGDVCRVGTLTKLGEDSLKEMGMGSIPKDLVELLEAPSRGPRATTAAMVVVFPKELVERLEAPSRELRAAMVVFPKELVERLEAPSRELRAAMVVFPKELVDRLEAPSREPRATKAAAAMVVVSEVAREAP